MLRGEVGANNKNCGARVDWFGFPISPHFPPFLPIFPRELSLMHPQSLVADQNHVFFDLFSPQIPHFSIGHPKFRKLSPISLNQPILDKCTVTFRKQVFLKPAPQNKSLVP